MENYQNNKKEKLSMTIYQCKRELENAIEILYNNPGNILIKNEVLEKIDSIFQQIYRKVNI